MTTATLDSVIFGSSLHFIGGSTEYGRRLPVYQEISAGIRACTACDLSKTRTQAVPGIGSLTAKIVIVGEAPGENEDLVGQPFVGRSGALLDSWLQGAGLQRGQVYILNSVQCRPPGNRDPHPSEGAACEKWLTAQLQLVQPDLVITLGKPAGNTLTSLRKYDRPMGKLRSQGPLMSSMWPCAVPGVSAPVVCLYHPSYVLRSGGPNGPVGVQAATDFKVAVSLALTLARGE